MALHFAKVLVTVSVVILPIINIYYLSKLTIILQKFKEGS